MKVSVSLKENIPVSIDYASVRELHTIEQSITQFPLVEYVTEILCRLHMKVPSCKYGSGASFRRRPNIEAELRSCSQGHSLSRTEIEFHLGADLELSYPAILNTTVIQAFEKVIVQHEPNDDNKVWIVSWLRALPTILPLRFL